VAKLHRETEDLHRKNIEASRLQREAEDLRLAAVQARQAGPSLVRFVYTLSASKLKLAVGRLIS
jgi:hypothetical protein